MGQDVGQDVYSNFIPRARVFWYAYVHESISNALRGRRLMMDEDDLDGFQQTLPTLSFPTAQTHSSHSMQNSVPQTLGVANLSTLSDAIQAIADPRYRSHSRVFLRYQLTTHHFEFTLSIAAACRRIHHLLTGPVAYRAAADSSAPVDEAEILAIWDSLEKAWNQFEGVREVGLWNSAADEICSVGDVDLFVSGWQIFLFECRESLHPFRFSVPTNSFCRQHHP